MQRIGIDRRIVRTPPETVLLGIGLDQRDPILRAARLAQIAQRLVIDREEAAGRAVFGRHVGDGRAVGERQVIQARTEEFDELADNALLAQHLDDLQHQIGAGGALDHLAGQLEAHDLGDQHGDRLTKHRGLGLDAADAPAQNRQAVDHGGVAVGADQRIWIGDHLAGLVLVGPDRLRQVFQVDLVADARARRDDAEVVERALAPLQEGIALHVPLILAVHVHLESAGIAEFVDHDRVVDDQVNRVQRVDLLGIATKRHDPVAHRGQVHHCRHAGEVLHQHAGRAVGDLARVLAAFRTPFAEGADVVDADGLAILEAQHVLEDDLERSGQVRELAEPGGFGGRDRVIGNRLAADCQGLAGLGTVVAYGNGHG